MKNICEVLSEVARAQPDALALVDRSRKMTFGELDSTTAGGVELLRARGLSASDTVLFFHPVSIDLYTALLSVFRAGMTAMFIDPSAGRGFIERCCVLRRPRAFFGSPKAHLLRIGSRSIRRIPIKLHTGWPFLPGSWRWAPKVTEAEASPVRTDAPALITFTSGSTGQPKAVARSHEFLIAQHAALHNALELRSGEVDLITLPIFTLANLGSGLTSVLADTDLAKPGEADVERVSRQIATEGVERVAASPSFFETMLEQPRSLAKIKRISTGGAPVFPLLLDRLAGAAPQAQVFAVYGSTEAEPIAHIERSELSDDDIAQMRGGGGLLVGEPVPEIDVRVARDSWGTAIPPLDDQQAFDRICAPADEVGEIVVAGDHVLTGYLDGTGDEETKFHVGERVWHRTGDAGRLDADGRLWLLGRCAAKLSGDKTLYPFAVECALSFRPEIRRCAAVEHANERVLVIEFNAGSGGEAGIEQIRQQVAWASFDRITACDQIPVDRRHQAKVDYPRLHGLLDSSNARRA